MYAEHPVPAPLAAEVACVWTRRASPGATGGHRVLPDGCVDVLFRFGAEPAALIVGTMTEAIDVPATTDAFVGIRFRPGRAASFLGRLASLTAAELTDRDVDLAEAWGADGARTWARLAEATDERRRVALAAEAVAAWFAPRVDPLVTGAIDAIEAAGGAVTIDALAARAGVSRQHLARRFTALVGVSPKVFARVVRLRRATAALAAAPVVDLATVAADAGYADQAHMNRDFRALAGTTPARFHSSKTPAGPRGIPGA